MWSDEDIVQHSETVHPVDWQLTVRHLVPVQPQNPHSGVGQRPLILTETTHFELCQKTQQELMRKRQSYRGLQSPLHPSYHLLTCVFNASIFQRIILSFVPWQAWNRRPLYFLLNWAALAMGRI